jgi:two-component system response regulator MprA
VLDLDRCEARRGERTIALTKTEFRVLECLLRHPNQVLSRQQICDAVWDYRFTGRSNPVDVYVSYLRRKLEAEGEPRLVHTVRGFGFVLRATS